MVDLLVTKREFPPPAFPPFIPLSLVSVNLFHGLTASFLAGLSVVNGVLCGTSGPARANSGGPVVPTAPSLARWPLPPFKSPLQSPSPSPADQQVD